MKKHNRRNGFSLVEVTVALGLSSFCLLVIVGLLPTGVTVNRASLAQTAAANLSTTIAADLEATPAANTTSSIFSLNMNGDTTKYLRENGSVANSAADARYRARVVTTAPATGSHAATTARILITWPATSDPTTSAAGSVDTVIALNRN